ncbi:chondroitinase-B domain-containing protein [Paenibacillus ferrarius]|uniref:chondroitinase-B domain-containing protein n=1 Tax=Paenibacillus ferrarius TaxID=1469647 RepID=UPI003D2DC7A6
MRSKRPKSYVSMLLAAALTACSFSQIVSASNPAVTLSTGFESPDFAVGDQITNTNAIGGWKGNASGAGNEWTILQDGDNGNVIQSNTTSSLYLSNATKSFPADSAFSGQIKDSAATGAGEHPGLLRYTDSRNFYALGLTGGSLEWRGKANNTTLSSSTFPAAVSVGNACDNGASATYCTLSLVVRGGAMYGSVKNGPALIAKVNDSLAMSAVPYVGFVTQKGAASFDNPFATDTPLGAPSDLIGTYSGTTINLTWSAVAGADSYVIRRATAVAGPYLYAGTSSTPAFTDTGVAAPLTSYYMVSPSMATPEGSSVEGVPAFVSIGEMALTGASGNNKIDLTWSGFASAASYTIWRSTTSDSGYVQIGSADSGTTTYSDTSAVNGSTYYYRVQAVTASSSKTPSLTVGNAAPLATTAGVATPNPPTGLTAAAGGTGIVLNWSPVSGANSYSIWHSSTSGSGYTQIGTTADGATTSYSDIGIANGTYYYVVQAVNTGGSSVNSAEASATLNAATLGAPTGVTATASGDATIALSWQPVSGATGYVLSRSMRSGGGYMPIGTVADGGATGYTDNGVENGTWYYTVQAVNPAGTGTRSAEATATLAAPDAPTGVTANASAGTQVGLQWNAVSGATGYKVLRSTKDGSEYTTVGTTAGGGTTSFADKHIASGTTYYYVVRATNNGGSSANSQQVSATPVYTISSDTTVNVSTAEQLDAALASAQAGTTIVLADGSYTKNGPFELKGKVGTLTSPITIKAAHTGRAIITGAAYLKVSTASAYVNVQGLRFTNTDNVSLLLDSSNSIRVTECSFEQIENPNNATANIPYMQIRGANSDYIQVDHNVFANKTQQGQGMSIDGNGGSAMSQYLTIEYNLFRNFGPRIANGMESIRLGLSGVSMLSGYAVVQYNEFDNADGDPESISVKSSDNTIRYNTFRNSQSQLTLRHGNGSDVYGNYFIGDGVKEGVGGIRVYGVNHKIYNNYFAGLTTEAILVDSGDVDHGPAIVNYKNFASDYNQHWPVYRTQVVNNTVVNSVYGIIVGHPPYTTNTKYFYKPIDTVIANNLVQHTTYEAYLETVDSNTVYQDNIGFTAAPSTPARTIAEVRNVDPQLILQADGLYRLQAGSAAIDAATRTYPYVQDDMDGQPRNAAADIGADEYSTAAAVRQPAAYVGYPIWLNANAITLQVEAENYSSLQGDLSVGVCPTCSGGRLMKSGASAATTPASLLYRFDVAGDGSYYVHLLGGGAVSPATLLVSVDGGPDMPVSLAAGAMGWSSTSASFTLSAGLHDLVLKPQEGDIQLDKLVLSKSSKPPIDASLPKASGIQVNGIALPDFAPDKYSYTVQQPVGTQRVPIVTATSAGAVQVTQSATPFGTAVVHVTDLNDPYQATDYTVTLAGLPTYGAIPERLLPYPIVGSVASDFKAPYSHTNAYDNSMSTRFAANGEQWATFDLGQAKPVKYVLISFYNGDLDQYRFDLETSIDNTVWNSVYSGFSSRATSNLEMFELPLTEARYIKFNGHGNSKDAWNNIVEIVIAGQSPVASVQLNVPDNLSVGQSAASVLSATYDDGSQAPLEQGVGFTSSNPGVASVDASGLIRAAGVGSTVITATYGLFQDARTLVVSSPVPSDLTAVSGERINITGAPVNITVPMGVTNVSMQMTATTEGSSLAATLPKIEVAAATALGNVRVAIPAATKVTAPSTWDGTIKLPEVRSNSSVSIGNATVGAVIEVGSSDVALTFDKAVRLLIPNQGGKSAGYMRNGVFTPITRTISADTQAAADSEIAAGGEAAIKVGGDLVIWTKHFTLYASYTPVAPVQDSGGGSGAPVNSGSISAASGGTITLNGVKIDLPAGAGEGIIQVTVNKLSDASLLPADRARQLAGDVYEITKSKEGDFNKPAVITLPFDKAKVNFEKSTISLYWLDGSAKQWVQLSSVKVDAEKGNVSGAWTHFGKFAVLASDKVKSEQPVPAVLTDLQGHWAEASVRELVKRGAINGYPDSTFKPDSPITRAEFVSVIVKAFHLQAKDSTSFADTKDHWAKEAIATAAALGVVTGYDDNTFGPDAKITREQMAVIVVRAAKLQAASDSVSFSDSGAISDWARAAMAAAVATGLIGGYEDGTVKPQADTTRAEAATIILRALQP